MVTAADAPAILAAIRAPGARATLVNVWATWCVPCREEFPELVRFERTWRNRGVRVLFVSGDFEDQLPQVRAFLSLQGVTAPSWIKTGDDMAFIDGLHPKWSGALPATFVYDSTGTLVRFWEGKADYARFESEIRTAMQRSAPS
jgi:thiol-disulfide isomerase/thioredoxin